MEKSKIVSTLIEKEQDVINWVQEYGSQFWEYGPSGKWTSGQQIVHLVQSMRPVNKVLKVPKFLLKMKFGKSNRPSRNYNQIKEKYKTRLQEVGDVVSPFSDKMPVISQAETEKWMGMFSRQMAQLEKSFNKWSESDLDKYIAPHPLLGMMTMREIIVWTAIHTEHHLTSMKGRADSSGKDN